LWDRSDTGADLLFAGTQNSLHELTGSESYFPPLRWDRPSCGRQVKDRATVGRRVHVEHGHGPGCARLAADQAADDEDRRARLPGLIVHSEDPAKAEVEAARTAAEQRATAAERRAAEGEQFRAEADAAAEEMAVQVAAAERRAEQAGGGPCAGRG
jgi:hypothetical protein